LNLSDPMDLEWRIFAPLLPDRRERGPPDEKHAANRQRHCLGSSRRRVLALHVKTPWQLERGFRALRPVEQASDARGWLWAGAAHLSFSIYWSKLA